MPRHQRLRKFMAGKVARVTDFPMRVLQQDATAGDASKQDHMVAAMVPVRARVDADQAGQRYPKPCLLAGFVYCCLSQRVSHLDAATRERPHPEVFTFDEEDAVIVKDSNHHA
jgi:BarA-like signal transduction histidine kinase